MAASASTERNTWRRLAPTIRRSANSRVRCPTVIEKVLKMVKPPTNRAMRAKITRAGGEDRQGLVDVARLLVDHGLAGHHLDPGGEDPGDVMLDGGVVCSRRGHEVDGVESPGETEELLSRGQVEGGDRRTGQIVGRAELQADP